MRIIHDVESPMQVGGSVHPYATPLGRCGYAGMRMELLACSADSEEAIYVEGNDLHIENMLRQMLAVVTANRELLSGRLGAQRPSMCPNCRPEDDQPNVSHLPTCPAHVNYELFKEPKE